MERLEPIKLTKEEKKKMDNIRSYSYIINISNWFFLIL